MARAFSANEAKAELNVSRSCLYKLLKTGQLKSIRAGKKILIPEWAIREFLQEKANA